MRTQAHYRLGFCLALFTKSLRYHSFPRVFNPVPGNQLMLFGMGQTFSSIRTWIRPSRNLNRLFEDKVVLPSLLPPQSSSRRFRPSTEVDGWILLARASASQDDDTTIGPNSLGPAVCKRIGISRKPDRRASARVRYFQPASQPHRYEFCHHNNEVEFDYYIVEHDCEPPQYN